MTLAQKNGQKLMVQMHLQNYQVEETAKQSIKDRTGYRHKK
jgi:hypothetical protein